MTAKYETIDAWLADVDPAMKPALEALRETIRAAAPAAEEAFSYGLPAFRFGGKPLAAFDAARRHCALYPFSPAVIEKHKDALAGYDISKGTIRFTPDRPLPPALVRSIVAARMAEIGDGGRKRQR